MKKILFAAILVPLFLLGCSDTDPIVGTWKAARVNIGFDEYKYTPDMVRQIGLSEKTNVIVINPDSTMLYISCGDTLHGEFAMRNKDVYFNGDRIAVLQDDTLVETKKTILGEVVVKYTKQ